MGNFKQKELTIVGLPTDYEPKQEQERSYSEEEVLNFAAWCVKKRVDFFDDTEIGETYTIDGFVSRYKMNELLEMYRNTTQCVV